ncbi:unnamed protein product [Auanema sp. JU1783]|nr:unnamed protein product [Auanema sp. JU1783]
MICGADGPKSFTLLPEALILSNVAVSPDTITFDQNNERFSFVFTFEDERKLQTYSCSFEEVIVLKASTIEPYFHVFSLKLKTSAALPLYDLMKPKIVNSRGFDPEIILTLCLSESAFDIVIGIFQQSIHYCDVTDAHVFLTSLGNLYSLLLYKKEDPDLENDAVEVDVLPDLLECSMPEQSENTCENISISPISSMSPIKLRAEVSSEPSSPTSSPCPTEVIEQHMISSTVELDETEQASKYSSLNSSFCFDSESQEDVEDAEEIDIDELPEESKDWSIADEVQEQQEKTQNCDEKQIENKEIHKSPTPVQLLPPAQTPKSNVVLTKGQPIVIEELSSDDDETEEQPMGDLQLKFVDGSVFIFPRESFEKNICPNSWLNDIMIDFFMDWISKECLTDEDRRNVHIFHTTFFTKLLRLKKSIGIPSNGTKAQIDQHMNFLFNRLYPIRKNQMKIDYLQKEVLMIPVFWENHWFVAVHVERVKQTAFRLLAMIHGMHNLVKDHQSEQRCRIIIVDSKMKDPLNAHILPSIHQQIFELLKGYVQLIVYTQFNTFPTSKFTFIRCHNLPDQRNSYDCGLFLVRYIKTFSLSRDFLKLDDIKLAGIRVPQSDTAFQLKIDEDRSQMKQLIEEHLIR